MPSLLTLLLQVAVIVVAARLVGWLFRRLHQPQVVGEMAAGILLGPSLLGWAAPAVSASLFPPGSLGYLNTLSQVGLLLFMFLVGLEFDPKLLRGKGHAAIFTSHVSITVPFFLGSALALYLYPRLSDASVSFTAFTLFMGAAMSITAFPVLARILTERNLLHTRVGALTLACAAVDDITAWTILAAVVAIVRASAVETPLWLTLGGTGVYLVVMVTGVRRALGWLGSFYRSRGRLTQDVVAGVLVLLVASAWITEWLGIHALFGAFAIGVVMPKDPDLVEELREKLEDVTVVFLLPLFFAFTGLRTSIGLVQGREMWGYAALVLLVAVAGKFGGSTLAARATALDWREAGALGILMNTRGLMELVILTIGLDLGVISPALFTMMVLMALATTAMTTPLLEWIYPERLIRDGAPAAAGTEEFTILLPVSLPSSGPGLVDAAAALAPEGRSPRVYALHLEPTSEQSLTRVGARDRPARDEVLQPLLAHARSRGVRVHPLAFASHDVARDIVDVATAKRADLLLVGWHKPVLGRSILSGTVATVLQEATMDAAVLVQRGPTDWRRILVPYRDAVHDRAALDMARRLARGAGAEVTILHVVGPASGAALRREEAVEHPDPSGRVRLKLVDSESPLDAALEEVREGYDLIVVGVSRAWGTEPSPFGQRHEALARASAASLLVVRAGTAERAGRGATAEASEPGAPSTSPSLRS